MTKSDLEERIDLIIEGSLLYFNSLFKKMLLTNFTNAELLSDFIISEYNIQNIKFSTKMTYIKVICLFSRYLKYKDFNKISKDDIILYLHSLKKTEEEDPTHKWIGTYNTRQIIFSKFFRWMYNKDEPDNKKWITPPCMQGIKHLPRKEKSPYKPADIWTKDDHLMFLKYCPESRDRCYHAMANDTSARPHELLSLKIKDILFKKSSTGKQYAEVNILQSKTRPRTLPLINSIPYVKEWIESHPLRGNPDAFLFIALSDKSFANQLSENALYKQYTRTYKKKFFPKLLKDLSIPDVDRSHIRYMLSKPFAPYIQRHSALTDKSQILKESTLRDHAGWSMTSRMPSVYIHYFGNESSKSLLEAYGIEEKQCDTNVLKSRTCTNCNEPNRPDARFCVSCRVVLTYDEYLETLEKHKQKDEEMQEMKKEINIMKEGQKELLELLKNPTQLFEILHKDR